MQNIGLEPSLFVFYAVDLVIMVVLLTGLRVLSGVIGNISVKDQLTKHDNPAFGISLAGASVALSIMLMGAVSGDAAITPINEALVMFAYGGLGIILMAVTRKVFDAVSFPRISIHDEVVKGNISAGIVDAGNLIATAIILRSIMIWVDSNSLYGLLYVVIGFVIAQILLLAATLYRKRVYAAKNDGALISDALKNGNTALALRFAGHRIGISLAVAASSGIIVYQEGSFAPLMIWTIVALSMFVTASIIAIIMRHAVLHKVNVSNEVDKQKNVAIGLIEGVIYVSVGLILMGLFG